MRSILYKFAFFGVLVSIVTSCLKPQEYPIKPSIEFKDFQIDQISGNTAKLSITFTDGDGDIGFEGDEGAPFNDPTDYYYYNLYIDYYEKQDDGSWEKGVNAIGDPIQFTYRIKSIKPDGKHKGLKGEIQVELAPLFRGLGPNSDEIKYKIKLLDKAKRESNEVETPVYKF